MPGGRIGALLPALSLGIAVAAPCGDGAPEAPTVRDDGRRTLRRLIPNLGLGAVGVFHRDNLGPLLVGTMATGVAAIYDDDGPSESLSARPPTGAGRPGQKAYPAPK